MSTSGANCLLFCYGCAFPLRKKGLYLLLTGVRGWGGGIMSVLFFLFLRAVVLHWILPTQLCLPGTRKGGSIASCCRKASQLAHDNRAAAVKFDFRYYMCISMVM